MVVVKPGVEFLKVITSQLWELIRLNQWGDSAGLLGLIFLYFGHCLIIFYYFCTLQFGEVGESRQIRREDRRAMSAIRYR